MENDGLHIVFAFLSLRLKNFFCICFHNKYRKYKLLKIKLKMLAAQYTVNTSDINQIELKTVDIPSAAPGMVIVKVHKASANPVDLLVMSGVAKNFGWDIPLPFTAGYDFAGTVSSIDAADRGKFKEGERVFAVNWGQHKHMNEGEPIAGAFAEFIAIPASKLSKIPDSVSFDVAAAVALVGTTAYQTLFGCLKLKAGQRVLILGGSTSVGYLAVQLAKRHGLWVATTCSTRNIDFVSTAGADLVVDYKVDQWDEIPELKNVDGVLDAVGETAAFSRSTTKGVVKADGGYVTICNGDAGFDPVQ
jgi:2-desacetyl-2-hydroxyethyl bacteriochlorophyllide A dehydrogenase